MTSPSGCVSGRPSRRNTCRIRIVRKSGRPPTISEEAVEAIHLKRNGSGGPATLKKRNSGLPATSLNFRKPTSEEKTEPKQTHEEDPMVVVVSPEK